MKKKILFAVMAAVMAVSCTESNKYVINGTIANNDGKTVYLNYQIGDSTVKDSAVIADGKFMFEGTLDRPYRGGVLIIGDMNDMQNRPDVCQLALEPGTITVDAEAGTLKEAVVKGGKTQTEMNELAALLKPMQDKFDEFNKVYYSLENDAQRDSLNAVMEPVRKEYGEACSNFYKTHPDSYIASQYVMMDMAQLPNEDMKAVYDAF